MDCRRWFHRSSGTTLRLDAKWVRNFLSTPEPKVRGTTRNAFAAANDEVALSALAELDGFKTWGAMATALLCAYDPRRWPVMDKNALEGLRQLGRHPERGTLAYIDEVRRLLERVQENRPTATVRDVDKGLFSIGREALDRRRRQRK